MASSIVLSTQLRGAKLRVKIPQFESLINDELRLRFEQEAHAAARLDHPNVASVLEAGSDGILPYIASVYYPGVTLADWLRNHRESLGPRVVAEFIRKIALALAHAHDRGVLHRDIKPSNILLLPPGESSLTTFALDEARPKLMDFGLAKLISDPQDMTQAGTLLGTLRYMSPEQASGRMQDVGPASDVYGLGALFYELLTGQPLFMGYSDVEVLRKISTADPLSIRLLRPSAARDLITICEKCLEKEPSRRYPSAQALAGDLDRYLIGVPIAARPAGRWERSSKWAKRNPAWAGMYLVSALSLLLILIGLTWSNFRISAALNQTEHQRVRAEEQTALARRRELVAREYAYGADMRLAQEAWDHSSPLEGRELLERYVPRNGEPDLRGIEWHYLWDSMHRYSQVVATQNSPVWSLAYEPHQQLFATGDRGGMVRLWSLDPPKLVRELKGHEAGDVDCVLFTPDGEKLLSAGDDNTIRLWRVAVGEPIGVWNEHHAWVGALAVSPFGTWLASGDAQGRILLWNLDTEKLVGEPYHHKAAVRRILFHPQKPWLVSASEDGDVRVWDYLANAPPAELPTGKLALPPSAAIRQAVFDEGGKWLFATIPGQLLQWDFRPDHGYNTTADRLDMPNTSSVAVLGGDKWLLTGGDDAHPDIVARPLRKLEEVERVLHGHSDTVRCLTPLPDGNTFLSGSEDGTVRSWQLHLSDPAMIRLSLKAPADSLVWAPDGHTLFAGLHSGEVVAILDARHPEPVFLGQHSSAVRGIAVAADSRSMLSVDEVGEAKWWDLEQRQESATISLATDIGQITLVASDQLLAYTRQHSLVAVDARTGHQRWQFEHPDTVHAITPLGPSLVTACNDGVVRCFDAETGRLLRQTAAQRAAVRSVDVSREGQLLATVSGDKTVRIYDGLTFTEKLRFPHTEDMHSVFFIDDDHRLLVFDLNSITILNPGTGQTVLKLESEFQTQRATAIESTRSLIVVPKGNDLVFLRLRIE